MKRSFFSTAVLGFVLAFLYMPIILVFAYGFVPNGVTMSFFNSDGTFSGLTWKWYSQIFSGAYSLKALMRSFWLSLAIAGLATLISCVLGTTAALALHKWRSKLQRIHHALVYTPLVMPDILIGISLLMLFVACNVECGFWTILIAHVTFCVSFVVMTILARLQDFDDRIIEAAYDLGAGPWYTFFKVQFPMLMPGIVAGGLLAFTLSIDDVVITSFVNGAGTNTFPTYVSSMTKHSKNLPAVFALSTLMLLFTCILAGISRMISGAGATGRKKI
jgi:spermidine/putrescine transport system permease protein